eukprot:SAG22_NODE_4671_length_1198_cov_1.613285_1_plen_78_part_00
MDFLSLARLRRYASDYPTNEAGGDVYPFAPHHPLVLQVVRAFGARRCVAGSNFPTEMYSQKMSYDADRSKNWLALFR